VSTGSNKNSIVVQKIKIDKLGIRVIRVTTIETPLYIAT